MVHRLAGGALHAAGEDARIGLPIEQPVRRVAELRNSLFDGSMLKLGGVKPLAPGRVTDRSDEPAARLAAPISSASADTTFGWLYEDLRNPSQHILPIFKGPHDYMGRVVINDRVTALQPASISVKTTVAGVGGPIAEQSGHNVTVRHESASFKTSSGTSIQIGVDVTRESKERQLEYIHRGEPVMDLILIETKGEAVTGRIRSELVFGELAKPPAPRLLIQHALSAGGYVGWRRVWIDPASGERSGIDVVLSMKSEGSFETGIGAEPGGLKAKAEIEATVRYYGPQAKAFDTHELARKAGEEVAKLMQQGSVPGVAIDPINRGDRDLARFKITQHLYHGTSVWQYAPHAVSGGLNQGHTAVALAIRVNEVLHETTTLHGGQSVSDLAQARSLLNRLWAGATPQQAG
jgi:hypothetical protein